MTGKGCGDVADAGRLRAILLDAGVGTTEGGKWSFRQLEAASEQFGGISYSDWRRLVAPIPPGERGRTWPEQTLRTAADTLRFLGATGVTYELLLDAMLSDAYESYESGTASDYTPDDPLQTLEVALAVVQGLTPDQRIEFLAEMAEIAEPAERAQLLAVLAEMVARDAGAPRDQEEGSIDERQDPRP